MSEPTYRQALLAAIEYLDPRAELEIAQATHRGPQWEEARKTLLPTLSVLFSLTHRLGLLDEHLEPRTSYHERRPPRVPESGMTHDGT